MNIDSREYWKLLSRTALLLINKMFPSSSFILVKNIPYVLSLGFQLLKEMLGESAFYLSGYPKCIVTNDSEAERAAVAEVWPQSLLLLSIFHVLQSGWRWLCDSKNAIAEKDRKPLILVLKSLVNAKTEDSFNELWETFNESALSKKYNRCTK